jgi:plasmid stabilization system protein ParE
MKIYWTNRSHARFLKIKAYINKEFGKASSTKFQDNVFDFLELLEKFPELGSLEVADKNIYGFQLSKQTRIFYRITNDHIVLLTFFDSRQHPNKKPK